MQTDSSASRTGREAASAVEWAMTVRIPISRQARMMRSAISPRLAMRILWNISPGSAQRLGRSAQRLHQEQRLSELDRLAVLHHHLDDASRDLGLDLVHQLHRLDDAEHLPLLDHVPLGDERGSVGLRRAVEGADHRSLHRDEVGGGLGPVQGGLGERGGRARVPPGPARHGGVLPDDADTEARRLHLDLGEVVAHRELDDLVEGDAPGSVRAASRSPSGHQPAVATRPRYSPLRVSTFTTSPGLRNRGTWTTAPVSRVAGFEPPEAVSPRIPGSVLAICSSMKLGSSTVTGLSLMKRISTSMFSLRKARASPTSSADRAIWSYVSRSMKW